MPNCLERHSLCEEANWGLPTQHFQKGFVWVSIKIFFKKHLNYLSVDSISLHNLGFFVTFVEPYLINFDVSSTRKDISMFFNIFRSHLAHKGHIINT